MSNTVTYSRIIRNASWLISYLTQLIPPRTLDYYSYEQQTSTLTLTFKNPVNASFKQLLDNIVLNYNENQAQNLSLSELSACKYLQLICKNDQIIDSYFTDIAFHTESYTDRQYFTTTPSCAIYIRKPGTYLILVRLTAYCPTNFVDLTTVQYQLVYDDTKTEQGYISLPNCTVYTTHRSEQFNRSSTLMACVFNCNPNAGSYIKIQGKVFSGSSSVSILGDNTNIMIINIPGAAYFESTINVNTNLTSSFTNFFLTRDRIVNVPFSHTSGQASLTIANSGWLFLVSRTTLMKTSGSDTSFAATRFFSLGQGIPIPGTISYSADVPLNTRTTFTYAGLIPVNAGTTITFQHQLIQGSGVFTMAGESGYVAMFLNENLFPQLSTLNSFTDVIQSSGPFLSNSQFTDLTFTTLRTLQPAAPFNTIIFSTSSPEIIVNDTGLFVITVHISVLNTTTNAGYIVVRLLNSVDGGKTYYYILGSKSTRVLSTENNKSSVTTNCLLPMSSGHRIKVQCFASNDITDQIQFSDSCTITLLKLVTSSTNREDEQNFGKNPHVIISTESMSIDTVTWVEKCRLVSKYLTAGVYRIGNISTAQVSSGETLSMQLIHNPPSGQTFFINQRTYNNNSSSSNQTNFHTIDYLYLMEGVHTFIMQFVTTLGNSCTVNNVVMELWQVN